MKSLILVFVLISVVTSFKILVVFPKAETSHYILGSAIVETLVQAGHEVTFITSRKKINPPENWKDVFLEGLFEEWHQKEKSTENMFVLNDIYPVFTIFILNRMGIMLTHKTLSHPAVQDLLNSNQTFDLVILEQFFNDALKGFAWHYKVPMILVSSLPAGPWVNPLIGNPNSLQYIPQLHLSYSQKMSFFQRVKNFLMYLASELNRNLIFYPTERELLKKYFPEAPPLDSLLYNASLVFLNSHISTSPAKPHVPALIEIGGFHVNPPKKLSKNLQDLLDNATEGAIYFSMGSTLQSVHIPKEKQIAIVKSFAKLKQLVLWKFEEDILNDKPDNVKIMKWFPQQDILAHPNIKAFITHGGLLSSTETIYHGVPVLCIPIFGDQKLNAAQYVINGFGLSLPYDQLNEQTFSESLNEILNNSKYTENVKKRSRIFHDRQIQPRDQILYWSEYVIRHQGAQHLRVAALDLAWYQNSLIDVIAFLILILIVSFVIFYLVIKWLGKKIKNLFKKIKKTKTS